MKIKNAVDVLIGLTVIGASFGVALGVAYRLFIWIAP